MRQGPASFWHVSVSVAGARRTVQDVRASLLRLAEQHPFLMAGFYADDRAEVHYWEEARTAEEASALALTMWARHREPADLPDWNVVGLEVHERDTYRLRPDVGHRLAGGDIRPY